MVGGMLQIGLGCLSAPCTQLPVSLLLPAPAASGGTVTAAAPCSALLRAR
jgi:hypothetical protein